MGMQNFRSQEPGLVAVRQLPDPLARWLDASSRRPRRLYTLNRPKPQSPSLRSRLNDDQRKVRIPPAEPGARIASAFSCYRLSRRPQARGRLPEINDVGTRFSFVFGIYEFGGRTRGPGHTLNQRTTGFGRQQQRFLQEQRPETAISIFTANARAGRKMILRFDLDVDQRSCDHPVAIGDHQTVNVTMMSKLLFELVMKSRN